MSTVKDALAALAEKPRRRDDVVAAASAWREADEWAVAEKTDALAAAVDALNDCYDRISEGLRAS